VTVRLSDCDRSAHPLPSATARAPNVDRDARASLKAHQPCVVWFTGLPGAGKSTIATLLERRLHAVGAHTYLLDGDCVRSGLNNDLGFSEADRIENIRRIAEVSKLMADAGLIVLAACISPFRAGRRMARELMAPVAFVEVHVDVPLAVAEARDPKGLYKKARAGEIRDFTGVGSPYEPPERPEVRIDTVSTDAATAADRLVDTLRGLRVIRSAS
jgi:bifunctional enzyme CysN/CysC